MQNKDSSKSRRIKISIKTVKGPTFDVIKQTYGQQKTRYMHGSIAAQRLGISSHLLSRITGTIYVIQTSKEELAKYNVGLNLKFNKRNEEVKSVHENKFGSLLNITDNVTHSKLHGSLFLILKSSKVPGYTRKENSQWLYSTKAIELIRNYMTKCPNLFERLAQNVANDIFQEEELFDKGYIVYFLMPKYNTM